MRVSNETERARENRRNSLISFAREANLATVLHAFFHVDFQELALRDHTVAVTSLANFVWIDRETLGLAHIALGLELLNHWTHALHDCVIALP